MNIYSKKGSTAVEYAVIIVMICLVCIVAITALGNSVKGSFDSLNESLAMNSATNGKCKDSSADKDCGIGNDSKAF